MTRSRRVATRLRYREDNMLISEKIERVAATAPVAQATSVQGNPK
ncbi:hypothetical protein U1872_06290 [Sphingomonas sp. RB3P16]